MRKHICFRWFGTQNNNTCCTQYIYTCTIARVREDISLQQPQNPLIQDTHSARSYKYLYSKARAILKGITLRLNVYKTQATHSV